MLGAARKWSVTKPTDDSFHLFSTFSGPSIHTEMVPRSRRMAHVAVRVCFDSTILSCRNALTVKSGGHAKLTNRSDRTAILLSGTHLRARDFLAPTQEAYQC